MVIGAASGSSAAKDTDMTPVNANEAESIHANANRGILLCVFIIYSYLSYLSIPCLLIFNTVRSFLLEIVLLPDTSGIAIAESVPPFFLHARS
jgi:hypothetical protein